MNARLAFEDYTALHHRLDSLPAVDDQRESSKLAFETRPAQEMMKEHTSALAIETRPQREMMHGAEEKTPVMWRSILQLRVLLPYVSKLLPLLEGGLGGHSPSPAQTTAIEAAQKNATEMQSSHREMRVQLQDQAVEFKRVEDQLERLREATERNTLEQQELIEDLKSASGTIKLIGWSLVVLLTGLLGGGGFVAYHLIKH